MAAIQRNSGHAPVQLLGIPKKTASVMEQAIFYECYKGSNFLLDTSLTGRNIKILSHSYKAEMCAACSKEIDLPSLEEEEPKKVLWLLCHEGNSVPIHLFHQSCVKFTEVCPKDGRNRHIAFLDITMHDLADDLQMKKASLYELGEKHGFDKINLLSYHSVKIPDLVPKYIELEALLSLEWYSLRATLVPPNGFFKTKENFDAFLATRVDQQRIISQFSIKDDFFDSFEKVIECLKLEPELIAKVLENMDLIRALYFNGTFEDLAKLSKEHQTEFFSHKKAFLKLLNRFNLGDFFEFTPIVRKEHYSRTTDWGRLFSNPYQPL